MTMTRLFAAALIALAACSSDPESKASPTPAPTTVATPSASPSATKPAATPKPVTPTHGGMFFGVYLAAGDPTSKEFKDRLALLKDKGLPHEGHDVNCDQGAADGLAISDEEFVVAVYFKTRDDAQAWAKTSPVEPLGIIEVQTYCLD